MGVGSVSGFLRGIELFEVKSAKKLKVVGERGRK